MKNYLIVYFIVQVRISFVDEHSPFYPAEPRVTEVKNVRTRGRWSYAWSLADEPALGIALGGGGGVCPVEGPPSRGLAETGWTVEDREWGEAGCECGRDESPPTLLLATAALPPALLDERGSSNGRADLEVELSEVDVLGLSTVCRRGIRRGPTFVEAPPPPPPPLLLTLCGSGGLTPRLLDPFWGWPLLPLFILLLFVVLLLLLFCQVCTAGKGFWWYSPAVSGVSWVWWYW